MRDTEMTNLTIGVLGGMGPEATAGFFSTLVSCDVAKNDQDHLHMIVDSTPSIPDRTTFLLGRGPDPLPGMLASACLLYTSDAADDLLCVDLGGRRIIKKKKKKK